jgi:hypothetical protein
MAVQQRAIGLPVGNWSDKLDAKHLRIEIVKAFEVCILDEAIWQRSMKMGIKEPQKDFSRTKRLRVRKSSTILFALLLIADSPAIASSRSLSILIAHSWQNTGP